MQDRSYIHRIYRIDHTRTCNFNASTLVTSVYHKIMANMWHSLSKHCFSHARAMLSRYQSATRKLFVYDLLHTQFPLFSNTLLCSRNFCELVILCVMLLCPNNLVHCYRNVRETQWTPNKPKTRRL